MAKRAAEVFIVLMFLLYLCKYFKSILWFYIFITFAIPKTCTKK